MRVFHRSMVVLEIGFVPWKATLLGTFFGVDKALKGNILGRMLELPGVSLTGVVYKSDLGLLVRGSCRKKGRVRSRGMRMLTPSAPDEQ